MCADSGGPRPRESDMRLRCVIVILLCAAACAALGAPPLGATAAGDAAASVDCGRARDPVDAMICASPALQRLDRELAATYVAALKRAPAQADALRQDERNWLGERNVLAWQGLASNRVFAAAGAGSTFTQDVPKDLAEIYQDRIAFLRRVARPDSVRGLPVAARLLAEVPTVEPEADGVLHALESAGVVQTPEQSTDSWEKLPAALPAPPGSRLRQWIHGLDGSGWYTLEYLPAQRLGLVYTIQGTAHCQYWAVFARHDHTTALVYPITQAFLFAGGTGCTRDDGSSVSLAAVDGHAVVFNEIDGIDRPTVDLLWRRRVGNGWGPEVRLRLRFNRSFKAAGKCADAASLRCTLAPIAVDALRRYLRNPWSLLRATPLTPSDRTQFAELEKRVQDELTLRTRAMYPCSTAKDGYMPNGRWNPCYEFINGYDAAALWFPARVGNRIVVGRIVENHIGAHPDGGWEVAFWGDWEQRWVVSLPTYSLAADSDTLLATAIMPPPKPPHP